MYVVALAIEFTMSAIEVGTITLTVHTLKLVTFVESFICHNRSVSI